MLWQVLCSLSPPDGCLQWHEGSSGSAQSFNNGGTGTHLASQVGHTQDTGLTMTTYQYARSKKNYVFKDKIFVRYLTKPAKYSDTKWYILATEKHAWLHGAGLLGVRAAGGGVLLHLLDCRHVSDQVRHFRSFAVCIRAVNELSRRFNRGMPLLGSS